MQSSSRLRLRLTCAAAGVALITAGCGLFGDDGYSLAGELEYLPAASEDSVVIQATDFDRVAEMLDEEQPSDLDGMAAWLAPASFESVPGAHFPIVPATLDWGTRVAQMEQFDTAYGVSLRDVSQFSEVLSGAQQAAVLHGDFDVDRIDEAFDGSEDGLWGRGEDGQVNLALSDDLPPMGYSIRLAEHDDRLMVARTEAEVNQMRDGEETLADDDLIVALAEAVDDLGWFSAMILIEQPLDPVRAPQETILESFSGLAVAVDHVEDTGYVHLVYAHDDEAAAQANADLYDEAVEATRILHQIPAEVSEIEVDDTLLLVTFELEDEFNPALAWSMARQPSPLNMAP